MDRFLTCVPEVRPSRAGRTLLDMLVEVFVPASSFARPNRQQDQLREAHQVQRQHRFQLVRQC